MSAARKATLAGEHRATNRHQRRMLETALERLLAAVEGLLADLDALDGDPDLEDGHDAEAQCEDEGAQTGDDEPDSGHMCNWPDEGDQTNLRQLPVYAQRPAGIMSRHQNVGPFFPVRRL